MEEFIAAVTTEAERQQISIAELARRANVSRPYLHRVLGKLQTPTLEVAERIADALGLSLKISA